MGTITDRDDTQQAASSGASGVLPMVATGLGVVALGVAIYLFVELRDARKQVVALQGKVMLQGWAGRLLQPLLRF